MVDLDLKQVGDVKMTGYGGSNNGDGWSGDSTGFFHDRHGWGNDGEERPRITLENLLGQYYGCLRINVEYKQQIHPENINPNLALQYFSKAWTIFENMPLNTDITDVKRREIYSELISLCTVMGLETQPNGKLGRLFMTFLDPVKEIYDSDLSSHQQRYQFWMELGLAVNQLQEYQSAKDREDKK